jgi:hypothetical protein
MKGLFRELKMTLPGEEGLGDPRRIGANVAQGGWDGGAGVAWGEWGRR